ncbi:DUF2202 domain-containing protein [Streptomyces sp. H51]|uniref:DUF2202 domain-containing protein n=1 Tax=Streptomyces sp. H51 TaxID=3111770 RepID=UPI002D766CDE|nr:DUF2202 domain-containing protein [Streptomyces sp. H51]
MTRNRRIATILTVGVLAVGGVATAGPVIADSGGTPAPAAAQGMHRTSEPAHRHGGHGDDAPCTRTAPAGQGTLTAARKDTLAGMAEEEMLAHDLYTAFAERYDVRIFDRIAAAETQHLTAVRTLLDRYDVGDPTTGQPAGEFADPAVQATYDRLLKQGEGGLDAALKAGRTVETDDVAALTKALSGLTAPDARQVYTHLRTASERHLSAFERSIADE